MEEDLIKSEFFNSLQLWRKANAFRVGISSLQLEYILIMNRCGETHYDNFPLKDFDSLFELGEKGLVQRKGKEISTFYHLTKEGKKYLKKILISTSEILESLNPSH